MSFIKLLGPDIDYILGGGPLFFHVIWDGWITQIVLTVCDEGTSK